MRRILFSFHFKQKISMEDNNSDGKKKTTPSIPANYVSILQLQERWNNEKAKKRKEEEEERRRKQQVEEDRKIEEEDLKKAEVEEKRLSRSNLKHLGRKKESMNSGEAKFVEKEKPEVTAVIGSGGGEDTAEGIPEKNRGFRRKRYDSRKKKKKEKKDHQDVDVVEDVVDCGCGSIAPPENITPVNDVIRVYKKEGEKAATRNKSVVMDEVMTIETQFEDLSIERGETKNLKSQQTKSSNSNWPKQRQKLESQRVRMPIGAAASTMVWVKKEPNERAGDGIASGVKPLNA